MIVKGLDKLPELLHLLFGNPHHPRIPVYLLEGRLGYRKRYPGVHLRRIKAAVGYREGEILDE